MDELVKIAEDVLVEKDIKRYIKEEFTDIELSKQEHAFLIEYIKTGKGAKSYQKIFGTRFNDNVAGVYASRLLRKLRFTLSDYMSYSGHDDERICEALDKLFETDPKEYLKYMSKFKGYDTQKVEIDVKTLPVLEIVTSHEDLHTPEA